MFIITLQRSTDTNIVMFNCVRWISEPKQAAGWLRTRRTDEQGGWQPLRRIVWHLKCRSNKTGNVRVTQDCGEFVQPLLLWKSNEYYTACVCICSLRCPTCKAHAPYYHLWPAPLYNTYFSTLSYKVLVKLNVGLLWLKLHSTRRGLFLLAHWAWNWGRS